MEKIERNPKTCAAVEDENDLRKDNRVHAGNLLTGKSGDANPPCIWFANFISTPRR